MGRDSDALRPSSRRGGRRMEEDDDDDDDDDDEGRVPRAAERRKVRSGRERVDVSSRGVMYCMMSICVWYFTILSYRTLDTGCPPLPL